MANPITKSSRAKRAKSDRLVRSFADVFSESDAFMAEKTQPTHSQERNHRLTEVEREKIIPRNAITDTSYRISSERQQQRSSTAINQRMFGAFPPSKASRGRLCIDKFPILLLLTLCFVSKGKQSVDSQSVTSCHVLLWLKIAFARRREKS